jgi:hypothetical protein
VSRDDWPWDEQPQPLDSMYNLAASSGGRNSLYTNVIDQLTADISENLDLGPIEVSAYNGHDKFDHQEGKGREDWLLKRSTFPSSRVPVVPEYSIRVHEFPSNLLTNTSTQRVPCALSHSPFLPRDSANASARCGVLIICAELKTSLAGQNAGGGKAVGGLLDEGKSRPGPS